MSNGVVAMIEFSVSMIIMVLTIMLAVLPFDGHESTSEGEY